MRKKQLTIIVASLLVVIFSVTLAYFTIKILGQEKDINVTSADLKVLFNDSDGSITASDIEPGWSTSKKFTVTNNSNSNYKYDIVIQNLINTFVTEGYLQYKITSDNGGYSTDGYVNIPKSSNARDTVLVYSASINVGVTQNYTIEFIYKNDENVDQSADMGKKLSGTLFIEKDTDEPYNGYLLGTLGYQLMSDNPNIISRTNYDLPFTENDNNTIYKSTENGKNVYYFAGIENFQEYCSYKGKGIYKIENFKRTALTQSECVSEMNLCELSVSAYMKNDSCGIKAVGIKWLSAHEIKVNNWVKFAGYYWRIIRTNADGSIRLIFMGSGTNTSDGYIGESTFNTYETSSSKYVGYMYGDDDTSLLGIRGNTNDSTIKTYIDGWYDGTGTGTYTLINRDNLLINYGNYLSNDAVYCNDRIVSKDDLFSRDLFSFDFYDKFDDIGNGVDLNPTYNCNEYDSFSVNNEKAKLKYPIGLMSTDEVVFSALSCNDDNSDWLPWLLINDLSSTLPFNPTVNYNWWTLTPVDAAGAYAIVNTGRYVIEPFARNYEDYYVRPVTSLKSCVLWKSGDGSASNPYEIVENGGC